MNEQKNAELQACLDRLLAGDESARNELVTLAWERLKALARKMSLGDRMKKFHSTDTIHGHAAQKLWKALEQNPPKTVSALFTLAADLIRKTLVDLARSHDRRARLHGSLEEFAQRAGSESEIQFEPASNTDNPFELALWTEFHQKAGELPEEERKVVDHCFYLGFTQTQTARILDISQQEVSRRWCRAVVLLPKLPQKGEDPSKSRESHVRR